MEHKIIRRIGRQTKELRVELPKAPEDFAQSEAFSIQVNGRTVPVHVEIPIDETNKILYVA